MLANSVNALVAVVLAESRQLKGGGGGGGGHDIIIFMFCFGLSPIDSHTIVTRFVCCLYSS